MQPRHLLLLAMTIAWLSACAAERPPRPDGARHRCVEIPSGLVECWLLEDALEERRNPR